jgi:hypothetical protein
LASGIEILLHLADRALRHLVHGKLAAKCRQASTSPISVSASVTA